LQLEAKRYFDGDHKDNKNETRTVFFFVENEILRMSPENDERKKLAEKKWLK